MSSKKYTINKVMGYFKISLCGVTHTLSFYEIGVVYTSLHSLLQCMSVVCSLTCMSSVFNLHKILNRTYIYMAMKVAYVLHVYLQDGF
jgi:hypothetical protein